MAEATLDWEFHLGDTVQVVVNVVDRMGLAFPLVGASVRWQMARYRDDGVTFKPTPSVSKSTDNGITIVNAANGQLTIDLHSQDTEPLRAGSYYHELEVVDSQGRVRTVLTGTVTLLPALIRNP